MQGNSLQSTNHPPNQDNQTLSEILKEIEKRIKENRGKHDDSEKNLKDFRRIFDQDSSRMNQTIFNEASLEETHEETLRTICTLVEILSRTYKVQNK